MVSVGFFVDRQKSSLQPSQVFVHLGMRFATRPYLVYPTEKRLTLHERGSALLSLTTATPRALH